MAHHPSARDLGEPAHCERSLARSRARRARAERQRRPAARVAPRVAAAAVLVGAVTTAGAAVPALTASAGAASGSVLEPGDAGAAVRQLQLVLGVGADGQFGPATARAVRRLQAALGISADGGYGPGTRAALRAFQARRGLLVDGVPGPATRAALGLGGGASGSSVAGSVVAAMRSKLGLPYLWGGNGPDAYDCSGLTQYAFRQAGVDIPRVSYDQAFAGVHVDRTQIRAGDLVFWSLDGPGASHVGVATGPTTAISATVHRVREVDFSSGYWSATYFGARRVG
jgi:peptidoglycan DL-endopeptidase CwlO